MTKNILYNLMKKACDDEDECGSGDDLFSNDGSDDNIFKGAGSPDQEVCDFIIDKNITILQLLVLPKRSYSLQMSCFFFLTPQIQNT